MIDLTEFGENVFAAGDIHGLPAELAEEISRLDIRNSAIIICGDIGLGFANNHKGPIPYLNRTGKDRGNHFYLLRGNHDNPASWGEEYVTQYEEKYQHVHYLQDMDEVKLAGDKLALIVPGAISVDRMYAISKAVRDKDTGELVYKRFPRVEGKHYWKAEHIRYDLITSIEKKYDLVIAHTGPVPPSVAASTFLNIVYRDYDPALKEDLAHEKAAVDTIIEKSGCKKWINGHYHIETKLPCAQLDAKFKHNGITVENVGICEIIQIDI